MKIKYYLVLFIILFTLLFYNLFCYAFVHKIIDQGTKYAIQNYFYSHQMSDMSYKFIQAINGEDATIHVFIKTEKDMYYRFIFTRNGNTYQLIQVNQDIPVYIR